MLYCAESASLACLETLVHLGAWNLPLKRFLVAVDIPEALWKSRKAIDAESLPDAWNSFPAMQASTNFGDDWLKRKQSAVLVVPSAIVPEDAVILINPQHADSRRIKAVKLRVWQYDERLVV